MFFSLGNATGGCSMTDTAMSSIARGLPRVGGVGRAPQLTTQGAAVLAGAALLWAASPILVLRAITVPPFLALAVAFASAFLVHAAWLRWQGGSIVDPPAVRRGAVPGTVGLVGAGVFGLLALRIVHPVEGAALSETWPVVGAALGAATGLSAADLVSGPGGFLVAAFLGASGALCWSAGGAWLRGAGRPHSRHGGDRMAMLFGLSAPACCVLHLCLEPRSAHDAAALLSAAAIGLGPLGLARILWRQLAD